MSRCAQCLQSSRPEPAGPANPNLESLGRLTLFHLMVQIKWQDIQPAPGPSQDPNSSPATPRAAASRGHSCPFTAGCHLCVCSHCSPCRRICELLCSSIPSHCPALARSLPLCCCLLVLQDLLLLAPQGKAKWRACLVQHARHGQQSQQYPPGNMSHLVRCQRSLSSLARCTRVLTSL